MANIPNTHSGLQYRDFLTKLAEKRSVARYLEVGVNTGHMFSLIPAKIAVGVDPNFILNHNAAQKKKVAILVQETSYVFFASQEYKSLLGGPPDFTFLDGMHVFEFLLRDFYNTERFGTRNSLIAMHDCLPLTSTMAHRDQGEAVRLSKETRFQSYWTGDVWKVVAILKKYRPDLRILCVNCPPTGLILVSNLDPSSTLLEDRYLEIVDEFRELGNGDEDIEAFYRSIDLIDSKLISNNLDHSLYLRA